MSRNIALVISELEFGGTQRQILELAKGLDGKYFTPCILGLSESCAFIPEIQKAGIPVTVILKRGRFDLTVLFRLRSWFRRSKIDAVITYGFTADLWGRVAAALARVPVVISSVRTSNEDLAFIQIVNRMLAPVTSHFISNSQAAADYVRKIGVEDSRITVIPNGMDFSRLEKSVELRAEIRRNLGLSENTFVVGIVSRLSEEKNVEGFLRIAKKFIGVDPDARFIIIGDGPQREKVHALAEELGISKAVIWLGERNDVPKVLCAFDVAMLTSFREGLSNAVIEYMAVGLPVVASKVGGNSELLEDGKTGFLFDVEDHAAAIHYLSELRWNCGLREHVGNAAALAVRNAYSVASMAGRTQELVLRLAGSKK